MTTQWIIAFVVLASGLLLGEIGGRLARSSMSRAGRSAQTREMARPVGTLLFGSASAVGLVLAIASLSPQSVRRIPDAVAAHLPTALLAVVCVVTGYVLAWVLATVIGQSALRASGVRHRGMERAVRVGVMGAAVVLALAQLGVDTTMLVVLMMTLVAVPGLAIALLSGLGGRAVAANLAAGRALRTQLVAGRHLCCSAGAGRVIALHAVTVELLGEDGEAVHIPLGLLLEQPFVISPTAVRT